MPAEVTVWEAVTALAVMVPVLSRPPTLVTSWVVVVGVLLIVVVTFSDTVLGVVIAGWSAETWVPRQVK